MATHLQSKEYYEDLYEHATVEIGRYEAPYLLQARAEFYKQAEFKDQKEVDTLEFWWQRLYWWLFELPILLPRFARFWLP